MKPPKVLVVSFDGGVWSNLLPLAKSGIMPNLAKLLEESKHGNLESTMPPLTPPAWSAFMTGCNPGKSGIFDFYQYQEGSYKPVLTSSENIQVATLWKILSDNGLRVGVIDVPMNYPPPVVNGFIISGWERPSNKKVFTYPPELGLKLIEKFGDYPICLRTFDKQGTKDIDFLNSLIDITTKVGDAALWLLETEPTDFFMVHFQATDIIQHSFWDQISTLDFNSEDLVTKKIWEFYKNLDKYLGLLKNKRDKNTNFFLLSDHGFGPVKRRMATNVWLMENGYLKLKQDIGTKLRTSVKSTAIKMVNKVDALARLKNRIKRKSEEELEQRIIVPRTMYDPINYTETRAFSSIGTVYGTIQLNLIGREPNGIVPEKESESLKDEIIQKLINVRDPISGESFIKVIHRKEEIFNGASLNKIPDLIIIPNPGFYLFIGTGEKELFCEAHYLSHGNHVKDGIVVACGSCTSKIDLSCAKITDILPTVMDIFNLKPINNIDGKSLFFSNVKKNLILNLN
ncbi:MAG: alkaline phosphatase family protein [Candidatus Melainabacteria bacterium]|nr:alkaline phosphatase family protein [Candidatus Melainabacteria bacterium]